jgi:hypothetical protein
MHRPAPKNFPGGKSGKNSFKSGVKTGSEHARTLWKVKGGRVPARRRDEKVEKTRRKPATTPEAREGQMVSAAIDLAEKQIRNGTASSQVITHYLKLGSSRERLEQQRLEHENELTRVRIEAIESQKRVEELYMEALTAMRSYAGELPAPEFDDED